MPLHDTPLENKCFRLSFTWKLIWQLTVNGTKRRTKNLKQCEGDCRWLLKEAREGAQPVQMMTSNSAGPSTPWAKTPVRFLRNIFLLTCHLLIRFWLVFTLHLCFIFYFFLIIKNHSHQFMVIPVSRVDSRWCQRDFPAQNCDVEKDWEPYGQFQKNNMAGSKSWKLYQNCFIRMNRPSSKTINSRALIGKLKRFNNGTRRFFQLATSPTASSQNLFEEFTGDPLDLREIQTYPQWKVQTCFRNLNRHQKKRSTQRKIYILPIGPFPEVLWRPLHGMEVSIFDLIANFAAVFFHGMTVKVVDEVLATEVKCKKRIHPETGKLQLLVTGKVRECWVINIKFLLMTVLDYAFIRDWHLDQHMINILTDTLLTLRVHSIKIWSTLDPQLVDIGGQVWNRSQMQKSGGNFYCTTFVHLTTS